MSSVRKFRINRRGTLVTAVLRSDDRSGFVFRETREYSPIAKARVFAVDTESLTSCGKLRTLITTVRWPDATELIETPDGTGALEQFCARVCARYGVEAGKPNSTAQRPRIRRKGSHRSRDGRRRTIEPVLSVWFNMRYDVPRMIAERPGLLRSVNAGADSYRIRISERYELEVSHMPLTASAPSFEWFIRDLEAKLIVRLLGIDMTGFHKCSLAEAAAAMGVVAKIESDPDWFTRPREDFTREDWQKFVNYAMRDPEVTLELYHATAEMLGRIDKRVIRRNGVLPPSAPSAATRIAFSMAFDEHPELRKDNGGPGFWTRAPRWVEQLGCDAYLGARVVCSAPGVHNRMVVVDKVSMYPSIMCLLPDPVTAVYQVVPRSDDFDSSDWFGMFGVLRVDGEGLDPKYPALRVRDDENRRLRYVHGPFEDVAATIPEIVLGVLSGSLRIDRIRTGVVIRGNAETSFLRKAVLRFFAIKSDPTAPKALQKLAKLLMNSLYGKLVEVSSREFSIAEDFPMPDFAAGEAVSGVIAHIYAEAPAQLREEDYAGDTLGQIAHVRDSYRRQFAELDRNDDEIQGLAVMAYIEALESAHVPRASDETFSVGDYVRNNTTFLCGQFFMPLYAAQITGLASAYVGALARETDALQGDTDSVHVRMPEGATDPTKLDGWLRYDQLLEQGGYAINVPEAPELADWKPEGAKGSANLASHESVLAREKLYSHSFKRSSVRRGRSNYACVFKTAMHAVTKWPHGDALFHVLLKRLVSGDVVSYRTKPAPRKLREAVLTGQTVGEFVSHGVTLRLHQNPNIELDASGRAVWIPLNRGSPLDVAAE